MRGGLPCRCLVRTWWAQCLRWAGTCASRATSHCLLGMLRAQCSLTSWGSHGSALHCCLEATSSRSCWLHVSLATIERGPKSRAFRTLLISDWRLASKELRITGL